MKKLIVFTAVALAAVSMALPVRAADKSLNERLAGYFVLSVEQNGELYYVEPDSLTGVYVANASETWQLIKLRMTGINNSDLQLIPAADETGRGVDAKGRNLQSRFKGRFLLAVESSGEVWYVHPSDGLRYYLGTGEQTFHNLRGLSLGINLADLNTLLSKDESLAGDEAGHAEEPANSSLVWEFASTLWSAYQQYNRDHNNYPEIKWFEAGLQYKLPIYFDNSGFTLDAPRDGFIYWKWDNFSSEFMDVFYNHFDMVTPGDGTATMIIELPSTIHTVQYGTINPGTYYFTTEHGFLDSYQYAHRYEIQEKAQENSHEIYINNIKSSLPTIEYTDAELGWEFASTLWRAYETYNDKHANYPEIKWFEGGLKYNAPIYFDDTGFTLNPEGAFYWKWDDFSSQFYKMFYDHFAMNTPHDGTATMKFELPDSVRTENFGEIEAGEYYFTTEHGLLSQADYDELGLGDVYEQPVSLEDADLDAEAQRVVEMVIAVRKAVDQYHNELGLFPEASEEPIVLGENGVTALYKHTGFYPDSVGFGNPAYLTGIQSGSPTTQIVYDSTFGRKGYEISFTLLGDAVDYESGVYRATPFEILRVGEAPEIE